MKYTFQFVLISFLFSGCGPDKNQQEPLIRVNHLVKSALPLICENDADVTGALINNPFLAARINPEIKKAIQDSIAYYILNGIILSNECLQDEILFSKRFFFSKFGRDSNIDSFRLTITRDLSDLSFNGYAIIGDNKENVGLLDSKSNTWRVSVKGFNHVVIIKEDLKTKALFFQTPEGKTISFPFLKPERCFLSRIKYTEQVKLTYSSGSIYSNSIGPGKITSEGNLVRVADNLEAAKKVY